MLVHFWRGPFLMACYHRTIKCVFCTEWDLKCRKVQYLNQEHTFIVSTVVDKLPTYKKELLICCKKITCYSLFYTLTTAGRSWFCILVCIECFLPNIHTHNLLEFEEFSRSVLHDRVPWNYLCVSVFHRLHLCHKCFVSCICICVSFPGFLSSFMCVFPVHFKVMCCEVKSLICFLTELCWVEQES